MVDEVGAFLLVRRLAEEVFHEQGLVAGGGDLRHEDHIIGVERVLVVVGEIGMHGMAHFMSQSKYVV